MVVHIVVVIVVVGRGSLPVSRGLGRAWRAVVLRLGRGYGLVSSCLGWGERLRRG